jgi:hypothetical protein
MTHTKDEAQPATEESSATQPAQPAPVQEHVASAAYDMVDRFLRNNLSSDADYAEYSAALDALYTAAAAQPAPLPTRVTEEMHVAAVKVLHRANGVDGLPQRMLDAMLAVQTTPPAQPTVQEPVAWMAEVHTEARQA